MAQDTYNRFDYAETEQTENIDNNLNVAGTFENPVLQDYLAENYIKLIRILI